MTNWRPPYSSRGVGRCREWETRMVPPSGRTSRRTKPLQVRCSLVAGHAGACSWHGVPFGTMTATALQPAPECGKPRARGGICRMTTRDPDGCPAHRTFPAPTFVSQLRAQARAAAEG